jgi:hypothetical protein
MEDDCGHTKRQHATVLLENSHEVGITAQHEKHSIEGMKELSVAKQETKVEFFSTLRFPHSLLCHAIVLVKKS